MIVIDKETNMAQVIDFAIPYDSRVDSKEMEKIEKCQDLVRELKRLWGHEGSGHSYSIRGTWNYPKDTAEKNEGHWH